MKLDITRQSDHNVVTAEGMNTAYDEIEGVVNDVDRENLRTKYTHNSVTVTWENLEDLANPQVRQVVVPKWAFDARTYLVGFAYAGAFAAAAANDIRLTLTRGNLVDGDKDQIERMAVYRPDSMPGAVEGIRDTVTEAFCDGDYVAVAVEEMDMTHLGTGTAPAVYTGAIERFELRLFFEQPLLDEGEL